MEPSLWIAVGTMLGVYALIATERMHRTTATLMGVATLLILHFIGGALWSPLRIWQPTGTSEAFHAVVDPIDLNVVFLLFGMMVIVSVLARTRVFQAFAFQLFRWARGRTMLLLLMLAVFTGLSSAFIDNVTTMLLVTPISLELALVMGVNPVVFLLTQVFASNVGGALTLVGDPPNILIGSFAGLTFVDFLTGLTPAAIVSFLAYLVYVRLRYADEVAPMDPEQVAATVVELEPEYGIRDRREAAVALTVLGFVTLLFMVHGLLGMEVAIPALIGAGIAMTISHHDPVAILEEVEWPTLVFFMMLFVIVGAVEATGALDLVAAWVVGLARGSLVLAIVSIVWVSAIFSALVDNIPFTATMLPVVGTLTAATGAFPAQEGLWFALALGADFGGNATLVGASANIVTAGLAERAGHPLTFMEFSRHGIPVMLVTTLVGTLVLLVQWGGVL